MFTCIVLCVLHYLLFFVYIINNCSAVSCRYYPHPRLDNRTVEYTDPVALCQTSKYLFVVVCYLTGLSYLMHIFYILLRRPEWYGKIHYTSLITLNVPWSMLITAIVLGGSRNLWGGGFGFTCIIKDCIKDADACL